MAMNRGQPSGGWGEMLEKVTGFPAPEKIMGELQRLNTNIEGVAPDLHKIAASVDGLTAADVRMLASVGAKIHDLTAQLQKFYSRLWGR